MQYLLYTYIKVDGKYQVDIIVRIGMGNGMDTWADKAQSSTPNFASSTNNLKDFKIIWSSSVTKNST